MSVASEALVKETPEPMKTKILFLKNSNAEESPLSFLMTLKERSRSWTLFWGELRSTPDFPG